MALFRSKKKNADNNDFNWHSGRIVHIDREAFERNCRAVELTPDHVPDINVITGVLKDYLRELPEPLFTRCLFQMTVDALGGSPVYATIPPPRVALLKMHAFDL